MKRTKVLITGTSSGLGWGLAHYYLKQGFEVYGMSRREPHDLVAINNYHHLCVDLSNLKEEQGIASFIKSIGNDLNLAILNAGILGGIETLKNTNIEQLKKIVDINLWSNKLLIDNLILHQKKIPQVVAISSGASINGSKGWGGYSISKAALNMMVKLYAAEHAQIHFTSLAPGLIDSTMQDYLCEEVDQTEFPSALRLFEARGTDLMPRPLRAGELIAIAIEKCKQEPSGSYLDVRKL